MYIYEIMSGRYEAAPDATAFPNDSDDRYTGMLVVRSELRSMCSHHHQPVSGVAYIGIIAAQKLIGLSKYTRIAQWCARRGTLQEELANDIAREIMKATGSENVAVYIQATHGCCENRGIMAHSSLTQTTVLKGRFIEDQSTKNEFFEKVILERREDYCDIVYCLLDIFFELSRGIIKINYLVIFVRVTVLLRQRNDLITYLYVRFIKSFYKN